MADTDQSLNNLRYNQISRSLEGFGGGSPQWTELTLTNVDPAQVPVTRTISTTSPLTGGGDLSANRTIAIPVATGSVNGYLSSADWTTFNNKQSTLTLGNLTDAGTDGITVTGGTGAVVGSGTSLSQHVSDSTHNGYLSSTDWSTFNSKLTATLASTNIFVGNGSNVATAVAMSGDATLSNAGALTIASHAITPAKISNTGTDDFSFPRDTSTARDFILTGGDSKNVKWVGSATATLGLEPGFSALDLGGVDYLWIKRDAGHLSFGTGLDAGFKRLGAGLIGVTTGTDSITGDLQAHYLSLGGTRGTSAALDVQSTTKGFLPPRVTTTERDAIATPATGLQVFNTTNGRDEFYTGVAWAAVGAASSGSSGDIQYSDGGGGFTGIDDFTISNGGDVTNLLTVTNGAVLTLGTGNNDAGLTAPPRTLTDPANLTDLVNADGYATCVVLEIKTTSNQSYTLPSVTNPGAILYVIHGDDSTAATTLTINGYAISIGKQATFVARHSDGAWAVPNA